MIEVHSASNSWLAQQQADGIGETKRFREVYDHDTKKAGTTLLGDRWLCRGGSCLLIGPSGVGKSSLAMQFVLLWALGRPAFGIKPARPIKTLVIQAENDDGDMHEMVEGVCEGIDVAFDEAALSMLDENLIFNQNTTHTGHAFTEVCQRLIDRHKPDLVVLDPLLSFIGADISKQEVCSEFLRSWLNPISKATGVIWFCVHHTGKPSTDPRSKKHWQSADYSYSGIGSSELTNWTRATMVLEQAGDGAFRLMLSKRGKRAGAIHPSGEPTSTAWLRHAQKGIFWQQVDPPQSSDGEHKGGKPSDVDRICSMNRLTEFLSGCKPEGEGQNEIAKRLETWLSNNGEDISTKTCKRAIIALASSPRNRLLDGGLE